MKTKIEVVTATGPEAFKQELQRTIDAIEMNINNTVIDIKYGFNNGFSALVVYKEKDMQVLNESTNDDVCGVIALDE